MVEGNHEGNDEDSLLEDKYCNIRQAFSHISKVVATNSLETLTP